MMKAISKLPPRRVVRQLNGENTFPCAYTITAATGWRWLENVNFFQFYFGQCLQENCISQQCWSRVSTCEDNCEKSFVFVFVIETITISQKQFFDGPNSNLR